MNWILLFCCISLIAAGGTLLKMSPELGKIYYFLGVISYVFGFYIFTVLIKKMPLSVLFPAMSGCTILSMSLIGIFFFNEPASLLKFICIGLVITGVIGLRLVG